ncbi:hypothetical protein LWM68_09140 [Niabella sp. W65]|nr:hypothetical protein [Niabella sp. W65]MCH7362917.1 hypothetical protein [Niabella sp. W65]ULT38863.1 hypothetical protein KRR40_27825 [Niabella sp. I65]
MQKPNKREMTTDFKDFFNKLTPVSPESWDKFSKLFTPKILQKGDCFIADGQTAREIGFLESGIMRAFYRNNEGIEYNKHFFVNPCFIGGYASLITGKPNQIIQQALTDCTIQVAQFTHIQKLYQTCADIERGARVLAEQFLYRKNSGKLKSFYWTLTSATRSFERAFRS